MAIRANVQSSVSHTAMEREDPARSTATDRKAVLTQAACQGEGAGLRNLGSLRRECGMSESAESYQERHAGCFPVGGLAARGTQHQESDTLVSVGRAGPTAANVLTTMSHTFQRSESPTCSDRFGREAPHGLRMLRGQV